MDEIVEHWSLLRREKEDDLENTGTSSERGDDKQTADYTDYAG